MASSRSTKGFTAPGVVLVFLGVAVVYYTAAVRWDDAFVGPAAASAPASGVALRGASAAQRAASSAPGGGSAALGASAAALMLLTAANNLRRNHASRSPARTIVKAEGGRSLEDLEVGETVTGKVTRDARIGVYVDIGAEKVALLPRSMVPKGKKYEEGEEIPGLKIWQVEAGDTPATRKIRVTLGELPTSFEVGQKVTGKVASTQSYGVFFSIGAMRDALAPARNLAKKPNEYATGEAAELEILSIEGDKITVGIEGVAAAAAAEAATTSTALAQLKIGDDMEGTIARVNPEYGLFINIGIGIDALCPPSQLDRPIDDYKDGDKINVKVANVDVVKEQVQVTTRPLASEAKVGETVEGTVIQTENKAGIFFDAGFSRDVLAPTNFLSKPKDEYTRGEVADLTIMQVDGDRVTVSDKEDVGKPIGSFIRGQEVTGKVIRYTEGLGIFLDVGASRDALWRTKGPGATVLPKEPQEYAEGEEVTGLIITRLDVQAQTLEVAIPGAERVVTSLSMQTLQVGEEVSGTVTKTMAFGVFVDIGAERDALYAVSQLEKPVSEYKVGDQLQGLRVTEVDPERQRLGVSTRPVAAEFKVGQEVKGKVSKIMEFGLFVDIGASVDALAPTALLSKGTGEYSEGQVLDDLKVTRVDIAGNKIAVGQTEGASSEATVKIDALEVGTKVPGTVRGVREYGVFVDIGLGRLDALMPNSMLGDVTSAAFKPNQKIEVYIAQVDTAMNRVTVSAVEPTAEMRARRGRGGAGAAGASLDSYIPQGFMIPDPKRHAEIIGREELMDPEPIPWYEWAEKFPGFARFQEKDQVVTISVRAHGFYGEKEMRQAFPAHIPIPAHLQKPDAKPPSKEDYFVKLEDQPMPNYDSGLKPEIHIKYRQPPLNDPNWREFPVPDRLPTTMDFKTIVERAGPFIPEEKPGLKKAKEEKSDD